MPSIKSRFNASFEKMLLKELPNMDLDFNFCDEQYTNPLINTYWKGFMMGINSTRLTGMFVIGTLEDNHLKMAASPCIHSGYKKASTEARRLAEEHPKQRFIVFNSILTFSSKKKRMPEAAEAENPIIAENVDE